ncbi:hypothetical protein GQX74_005851 [Glossina fuscipes]|nr:hypothetical protein GQX74_005851 [Glossina fuscipes]
MKYEHVAAESETPNTHSICDGAKDCSDGSDEILELCVGFDCPEIAFHFGYGACINGNAKCNGIKECTDGSDEAWEPCSVPRVCIGNEIQIKIEPEKLESPHNLVELMEISVKGESESNGTSNTAEMLIETELEEAFVIGISKSLAASDEEKHDSDLPQICDNCNKVSYNIKTLKAHKFSERINLSIGEDEQQLLHDEAPDYRQKTSTELKSSSKSGHKDDKGNFSAKLEVLNHHELEIVNLGFNEFGVDGALVLITDLKNTLRLRKLILDSNQAKKESRKFGRSNCEPIKNAMRCFKNPDVLEEMLEDQSEIEDDEDLDEENGDGGDEDYNEGNIDETYDEEDELYDDHHNDTTEEVEEGEDYMENATDKTAYTTSQDFAPKLALLFKKPNCFYLIQKPCLLQMFDSLRDSNKLKGFMEIINEFQGDNHLLLLVFTALKCALVAHSSSEALELAVALYQ